MQVTSNWTKQTRNYSQVAAHNHRDKAKTSNRNIDWPYTKYDVLNRHPLNYKATVYDVWKLQALRHDIRQVAGGHSRSKDLYGKVSDPKRLNRDVKLVKAGKFSKDAARSVAGMPKKPYKTFTLGFGNGYDRAMAWKMIKKSRPDLSLGQIISSEARAADKVPKAINQALLTKRGGIGISDYDVHVDEIKKYLKTVRKYRSLKRSNPRLASKFYSEAFKSKYPITPGQLHLQGRMVYWTMTPKHTTAKGKVIPEKPSLNFNKATKQALAPHKQFIMKLDKKYHNPNNTKIGFRNSKQRFAALNLYLTWTVYHTVSKQLEQDYPKANLDYQFVRTGQAAGGHEAYQAKRDVDRKRDKDLRDIEAKAKAKASRYVSSSASVVDNYASTASASASVLDEYDSYKVDKARKSYQKYGLAAYNASNDVRSYSSTASSYSSAIYTASSSLSSASNELGKSASNVMSLDHSIISSYNSYYLSNSAQLSEAANSFGDFADSVLNVSQANSSALRQRFNVATSSTRAEFSFYASNFHEPDPHYSSFAKLPLTPGVVSSLEESSISSSASSSIAGVKAEVVGESIGVSQSARSIANASNSIIKASSSVDAEKLQASRAMSRASSYSSHVASEIDEALRTKAPRETWKRMERENEDFQRDNPYITTMNESSSSSSSDYTALPHGDYPIHSDSGYEPE